MWRSPAIVVGSVIFLILVIISITAPYISPHDPFHISLTEQMLPPLGMEGASNVYPLGTDYLGRDVLSWLLCGTRVSFLVSILVVFVAAVTGITLGIVSGYLGGKVDAIIMRLVDFTMAFPIILFALMLAVILGPGILTVVLIICLNLWAGYARMARGETLRVKSADFIAYAKVVGVSKFMIMLRHVFPNVITPLVVLSTIHIGKTVLFLSTLSFLGAGLPPSIPNWGSMIAMGRPYLASAWWITIFPSLAITIVVLCFNMMGDKLNEYLNPEL